MGKIYKATTKVAQEQGGHQLNGDTDRRAALISTAPVGATEQFDFMEYSLDPTRGLSLEQREKDALERQASLPPTRQVKLDFGRLDPHLVMLNECDPAATQQYQRLAATLMAAALEQPLKRVLIASAHHGDGRTCVTLNLAGALAQAGRRVLVVDADLARPSVLRLLGLESEAGAGEPENEGAEEFAGDASPASDRLLEILPSGFNVLPHSVRVGGTAGLLVQSNLGRLLDSFEHCHDFILLDSAPLLASGTAHLLLYYADTALLVVVPGKCSTGEAARAISPFPPEDIFGVVLNRTAT